jgi:quinol monooxygenase YgiN
VPAFAAAGALLLVLTLVGWFLPLHSAEIGDRTAVPYGVLPEATPVGATLDDPVEVVVRYRVAPGRQDAFLAAVADLRASRRRTGATQWALLRDAADPGALVERYRVASLAEHRDQHRRRLTPYDHDVEARVDAIADVVEPAQHLLLVPVPRHHRQRSGGPA